MKNSFGTVGPHTYSDGIFGKKIVILGINPPPLGGISIHVQRVADKFRGQGNTVILFDTEKRARGFWGFLVHEVRILRFLIAHKPDLVYHHTLTCFFRGRLLELALVVVLKRVLGYQLIMVDHVSRFFIAQSWLYKKIVNVLFCALDQQVLIGSSTYASYRQNGLYVGTSGSVEAAFLPPDRAREKEIMAAYPVALHDFLSAHAPVVLANASKMVFFSGAGVMAQHTGKELYGFDLCLESLDKLQLTYPRMGIVFALSGAGDEVCFKRLLKTIEKKESVYLMYQCPGELWPLLKCVDLFIRPTLSDGASVSLQEALYFGTPVVASDVCERPAGTVLFKTGDQNDFVKKVSEVLNECEAINIRRNYSHAQQTSRFSNVS